MPKDTRSPAAIKPKTFSYEKPVRGSIIRCSNRKRALTRFLSAPVSTRLTLISNEPSASIKPDNQALLSISLLS